MQAAGGEERKKKRGTGGEREAERQTERERERERERGDKVGGRRKRAPARISGVARLNSERPSVVGEFSERLPAASHRECVQ